MHLVNSPNCLVCGLLESNTHIFTECLMVGEDWGLVSMRLLELLPEESARCSNFEMISLMFEQHVMDRIDKIEHIVEHLKLKYRANQVSSTPSLGFMSQIS